MTTEAEPGVRSRGDELTAVALIVVAWVGAAAVLAVLLFALTFLDDCTPPACNTPRGVHAYLVGVVLTAVLAYAGAHWTFAGPTSRGPRRRGIRALLVLVGVLVVVALVVVGTVLALDLDSAAIEQQHIR